MAVTHRHVDVTVTSRHSVTPRHTPMGWCDGCDSNTVDGPSHPALTRLERPAVNVLRGWRAQSQPRGWVSPPYSAAARGFMGGI